MPRLFWTQARIAELNQLWSAGQTAAAIGAALGGITRAAVLGKVFRLRLKAQDRKRATLAPGDAPARRRAGKSPPPTPLAAKSRRKTLLDLTNECCRWPYGELGGKRFFFCGEAGADVARGIPYCPRHMARAYIVPPSLVKPLHKMLARAPLKLSSASNPADNADNLTKDYLDSLARLPERQRKRFYEGVYIDELDGALFSYEIIARARVDALPVPRRVRIVVAVDPSGASSADDQCADEIGIIVAAKGDDGHAYVLADRSLRDAPAAWGRAAVHALHEFDADCIVAEENFGGEMVRFVIRAADPNVKVHVISASRGKVVRAEPVSAFYEQGLVHHVGRFRVLEDQLCAFTTAGYRGEGSPDHADALVFAIGELLLHERAAILEFYRRRAEDRTSGAEGMPSRERVAAQSAPPSSSTRDQRAAAAQVRLQSPQPISGVHGPFGTYYMADGEHFVLVNAAEAPALIALGFVELGADAN
jgi:hypothetical protein